MGRLRRYASDNGLTRLLTLTRADQTSDVRAMVKDLGTFQRRMRDRYPELVWLRVLERHKSGAIHAHYAISSRLDHATVTRLWGRGHVWLSPKVRTKRGGREDARANSRYVAKYVAKDPVRAPGGHRYEVRQGFQPEVRSVWVDGLDPSTALAMVAASAGVTPRYEWTSAGSPDWLGPPVAFASW